MQLPNWMLLHWILNPGLVVNELILGQRIPKLTFVCKSCQLPYAERNLVPCPSCNTLHDSRAWLGRNGFGNWLGLICPSCSARIPCLWNLTSIAVLLVLFPVWYLPYRLYFKNRHVSPPSRIALEATKFTSKSSMRMGVTYGVIMWVALSVVPTIIRYSRTGILDEHALITGAGIWLIAGSVFGVAMHLFLKRKGGA